MSLPKDARRTADSLSHQKPVKSAENGITSSSSSSNHEAYEPYLEEIREINKIGRDSSCRCSEDEESLEESVKEEEGDAEAEWLKRIGLGSLVSQIESKMAVDPSVLTSETMTLTARQFEAVRTRVNTLTATMRRRMEQTTRTDVREVFSSSPMSPTNQLGAVGSPPASPDHRVKIDTSAPLPNFTVAKDLMGITRIGDLSSQDMDKIRCIALIELTATFDFHTILVRVPRVPKLKTIKETGVFGVPLENLLERDQLRLPNANLVCPLFVDEICTYLENHGLKLEGILRVPGNAHRIKIMIEEIESSFALGQFSWDDRKPTDVSSILKQFLRQLPIPLLTRQYLPSFDAINSVKDIKEQVRVLNLLILLLPDVHQAVLKRLLQFCDLVSNSGANKMDLNNVAMVMAPNLFFTLSKAATKLSLEDVSQAARTSHLTKLLIKYHNLLWTIPGEMVNQVRYLYESETGTKKAKNIKDVKKMLNRRTKSHSNITKEDNDASSNIIRVRAPLFMRVSMAVGLADSMTAGDIVTKFQKKSSLNEDVIRRRTSQNLTGVVVPTEDIPHVDLPAEKLKEQFLHEVGGNIGERCLDPETQLLAVYKANPSAHWVIKPRNCPDLS
ncbi:rho GTPase-activating protein 18-like isoform X2 [Dysidea avara]|uniref:rho GTPase-activating protein 18-like isoform X2 n=1 Tax=Dysidea avara TaxID=196820 RepID=UPI0033259161